MIEIVKLKSKHIAKMAEIEQECFKTPWTPSMLLNELINPLATYFVAEFDGVAVGYIGYYKIFDEGHITNVAVEPKFQRQKIAFRLIETLIQSATNDKINRLTLEVSVKNERAIKIYESFGFRCEGRRPKYYEGVDDALIYWLKL